MSGWSPLCGNVTLGGVQIPAREVAEKTPDGSNAEGRTRCCTYISTIHHTTRAAAEKGKQYNVLEGRGTAKPLQWLGAPWIDEQEAYALADDLNARDLPGVTFRLSFATPAANKHTGAFCGGIEVHVTDPAIFMTRPPGGGRASRPGGHSRPPLRGPVTR